MGAEGTQVSRTLSLTSAQATSTQRLWLQTHNIRYPEKASVRINGGAWVALNNTTATMLGTSATYGGIGGSFAVLKMTLPVSSGQLVTGNNTVTFRFNVTNGLSSGYRIVNLNLLDSSGNSLLPASAFTRENPAAWLPPLPAAADIAAGENLWRTAGLKENYLPGALPIQAKCTSCHLQDGADLKYFSYSNDTIIERAKFHGLTPAQGSQIASYIRTLPVKSAGRPWNPPYQPGPGTSSKPNDEWLAGAGIENVLDDDSDTLAALFPDGVRRDAIMEGDTNNFKRFSSHDTPLAFQLPDWNHWLPEVHPLDALPEDFPTSGSSEVYNELRAQLVGKTPAQISNWVRFSNNGGNGTTKTGKYLLGAFNGDGVWAAMLRYPGLVIDGRFNDPTVARKIYSWRLWAMVKHVEIHEEFALTGLGLTPGLGLSRHALPRMWVGANRTVFDSSPFLSSLGANVTGSSSGNNAFNHIYISNSWYQLQLILNGGQRAGRGHEVIDWGYTHAFLDELKARTGLNQIGRNYVWALKGMDEGDNDRGPNQEDGWSFNRATLRPVTDYLPGLTLDIPGETPFSRAAVLLLQQVWLEKNTSWLPEQFFAHPDGTPKSGNEDGTFFNTKDWTIGSGTYEFQVRSVGQSTYSLLGMFKTLNTLPPALLNGYVQWAQAVWPGLDGDGISWNNWMPFSVPRVGSAPSAPTVMNAALYGDVRVSWNPVAGVTSYNVKRSTTPDGPFLTVAYFRTSGEYTDSVPLQNQEYYYKLTANTAAGESPDSSWTGTDLLRDRLLGTLIGTPHSSDTSRHATDGNRHTIAFAYGWNSWTGLDLGSAKPVTRIGYIPERGQSPGLVGGRFEASNSADFSSGVVSLHTISADPGDGYEEVGISVPGTFRYVRYRFQGGNAEQRIAEITFWNDTAATPTFGLAGGTYTGSQAVTISTVTTGATIRYTTDGIDPTSGTGTLINGTGGSVTISSTAILKARAFKGGAIDSGVASAAYTINVSGGTPVDRTNESGGTVTARASINASEDQAKAFDNSTATKWLDNGGVPSTSAPSWIQFEFPGTGYAVNSYTITSANDEPGRDPRSWRLKGSNDATPDWSTATVLDTQSNQFFASRFDKKSYSFANTTVYNRYRLEITANYGGGSMTQLSEIELFTPAETAATPTFSLAGGTFTGSQAVTISTATAGATIRYTTDGVDPTSGTGTLINGTSGSVAISSTATLKARAFKSDVVDSGVASATYTINMETVATPTFSLAGGTYNGSQAVTIGTATTGSTIRYTTNGVDPTSGTGTLINGTGGSVTISSTAILKARAFKGGAIDSGVASAAYTINVSGGTPVDRTNESGGTVTARASINASEDQAKAFDNSTATKWLDNGGVPSTSAPSWIQFEFPGTGYAVNSYTITSANDEPGRDPRSWRLKGSNDATPDWSTATVLDTQSNQFFANRFEKKSYFFANTTVYNRYRLEITANRDGVPLTQLSEIELFTTGITGGGISREVWTGISGTAVSAIPLTAVPNIADELTSFEIPSDVAENYGTRVRGYLTAPTTGTYYFWIAGDDNCELWLSSDGTVANKGTLPIARVTSWTSPRQWNKETQNQKSVAITLQAGQSYYIEALHKEAGGGDNMAVGWSQPGQASTAPGEVVPGSVLSPFITAAASYVSTDATTSGTWKGVYGAGGYSIAQDTQSLPAYVGSLTFANQSAWTWNTAPTETKATQRGGTGRIAAKWYSGSNFDISVNITGGTAKQVAIYCLDWDHNRTQTIQPFDAISGVSLAPAQTVSSFQNGKYLIYNVRGNVRFRVTNTGTPNAGVSAVLFGN